MTVLKGKDGFESFYRDIYGQRWEKLKQAFLQPPVYQTLSSPLLKPYHLDPASVVCARSLPVSEADRILDSCAAPGGKTLVLSQSMPTSAAMMANDVSPSRVQRLRGVLSECLDSSRLNQIQTTQKNICHTHLWENHRFGAILLDAPCSSERHLLTNEKLMRQWGPSRPKRLAGRQLKMLRACWGYLEPKGYLLFSTCSINPAEMDGVVQKFISGQNQAEPQMIGNAEMAEKTKFGQVFLPDKPPGWGPLYFSLIKKKLGPSSGE